MDQRFGKSKFKKVHRQTRALMMDQRFGKSKFKKVHSAVPMVQDIYAHVCKHIHVCAYLNVALAMRSPRPPQPPRLLARVGSIRQQQILSITGGEIATQNTDSSILFNMGRNLSAPLKPTNLSLQQKLLSILVRGVSSTAWTLRDMLLLCGFNERYETILKTHQP